MIFFSFNYLKMILLFFSLFIEEKNKLDLYNNKKKKYKPTFLSFF